DVPPTGATSPNSPIMVDHGLNITSKLVIGGLGLMFVVIVGAMLFATNDGDDDKTGDKTGDTPGMSAKDGGKPPVDVSALPKNRASIVSNVKQARVILDGEFKCETPCTLEVPVGDGKEHEIILRKDGYVEVMTKWQPKTVTERPPQLPDLKPAEAEIEM
ncbi:MAG TPA: PEGA domain-containing protein, partial [Enhygromyxa sp.]|nr:PEGA domain-containing protein [Enhygromyxa sp.]